jgi:hypothetical protein
LDLDGRIPPDKTISLEEHLARCADCRAHHADLQLGRRLLRATEPELPENFDWRLHLKLNQTLQAVAREATLPWDEPKATSWRWWRNFGLSAAGGLAVAAAVALFAVPQLSGTGTHLNTPLNLNPATTYTASGEPPTAVPVTQDLTRRPLIPTTQQWNTAPNWRSVSQGSGTGLFDRNRPDLLSGWSSNGLADLRTITSLRDENQRLRNRLTQANRDLVLLQRQLDTLRSLHVEQGDQEVSDE